jgi:hypothetical protein
VGQLNGEGKASASLYWKPEAIHLDMTLYFCYVILSPGMRLPVLAASNPVNATAVLIEKPNGTWIRCISSKENVV